MRRIRSFEEKLEELVKAGKLAGFLHLYVGEEAVAVGVCAHLRDTDVVTSTHRGHGHCIAKGVEMSSMMAEIFGRATGICKGKGGSMHIADLDKGMLGANGIVGAGIPLATGAGLTARLKRTGGVAVAFFGDGASNQGQFHESLNMAANWSLPVVYVVENNGFGEFTPTDFVVPVKDIAVRCKTYRFHGHFTGDPLVYRSKQEAEEWIQQRDPLQIFETRTLEAGLLQADDLRRIDASVQEEVASAVDAAESAPLPEPADVLTDVYVE
jgi:pyruvate dehydrogenase E1 component alpha subunit